MKLGKLTKDAVKTTTTSASVNIKTAGLSVKTGVKSGSLYIPYKI